jgi:hypothetical protein
VAARVSSIVLFHAHSSDHSLEYIEAFEAIVAD